MLFTPVVISGAALALIFANVYNARYGLLNSVLGWFGFEGKDWLYDIDTALPAVAGTFAFNIGITMVLVMAEVTSIPGEVIDAARVDGASPLQRQWFIVLPLLRHVTGTCVLLSLLSTLAFFDVVYILTSGGPGDATVSTRRLRLPPVHRRTVGVRQHHRRADRGGRLRPDPGG